MKWIKGGLITAGIVFIIAVIAFLGAAFYEGFTEKENPIGLTLRASKIGFGSVAVFRNKGQEVLHNVHITAHSSDGEQSVRFVESNWRPGDVRELGWGEGWVIESGEQIVINIDGYTESVFNIQ